MPEDEQWISALMTERWGSDIVVVHDTVYKPVELQGFVAILDDEPVGLITYHLDNHACEIVTLDSLQPSFGVGSTLIEAVMNYARDKGCKRIWLMTTNDNLDALRFYQKRGFVLVSVYRNAGSNARKLKPEIPEGGENGIPIRDEI